MEEIPVPTPLAKPQIVLDDSIQDVGKATKFLFIHKNPKLLWSAIIFILIFEAGLMFTFISDPRKLNNAPGALMYGLMVPVVLLLFVYNYIQSKVRHQFMQQFAKANNFSYSQSGWPQNWSGALSTLGHDWRAEDFVAGQYKNHSLCIFNYRYTTGSGKSAQTHYETVLQITHNEPLPPLLLIAGKWYTTNLSPVFAQSEKLTLEGDYNKYFTLYTRKEFEVEALQIFSPEFMEKTKESFPEFSIEFKDNQMFIYHQGYINTKLELQKILDLAEYSITELEPVLERMQDSLVAMNQQAG